MSSQKTRSPNLDRDIIDKLMAQDKKVAFIVISRGFIVRNILRSGVLDGLVKRGFKVILFFLNGDFENEKRALSAEFNSNDVTVEFLPPESDFNFGPVKNALYRLFKATAPYLVYSDTTWMYSRIGNERKLNRSIVWAYLERFLYRILSRIKFLKDLARFIEMRFFYKPIYAEYFRKYSPSVVFSTSIISKQDIQFLKEARQFKVPSVSMPKGWDNISKLLYRATPDHLIVQNEIMKADAMRLQHIPDSRISVCGFPQFDWYRKPELIWSREKLLSRIGLSTDRRLIFFGSEGAWAPTDDSVATNIINLMKEPGALVKPCSLLIRPHFSDVHNTRFEKFKNIPNVRLDDNFTLSYLFGDNWNPSHEETELFINCLYHADMMITVASTLVLDAAAYDKPSIGVAYEVLYSPTTGKDISEQLYETDHFRAVVQTGAIDLVRSNEELKKAINQILLNPDRNHTERQRLIREICFKIDGQSSERIATVIDRVAKTHRK